MGGVPNTILGSPSNLQVIPLGKTHQELPDSALPTPSPPLPTPGLSIPGVRVSAPRVVFLTLPRMPHSPPFLVCAPILLRTPPCHVLHEGVHDTSCLPPTLLGLPSLWFQPLSSISIVVTTASAINGPSSRLSPLLAVMFHEVSDSILFTSASPACSAVSGEGKTLSSYGWMDG